MRSPPGSRCPRPTRGSVAGGARLRAPPAGASRSPQVASSSAGERSLCPMAEERKPLGLGKACPHCGVRSATLGGVCSACGQPYERRRVLLTPAARFTWGIVLLILLTGWVWLLLTNVAAAIVLFAAGVLVLVATIGIVNALADRGG